MTGIEGERNVEETECTWAGPTEEWRRETKIFWTSALC